MIELAHGRWEDVIAPVRVDALITDPPFSARTHETQGHTIREARNDMTGSQWAKHRERKAIEACDALITDPPYGSRTHTGHNAGVDHTAIGCPKWDTARRRQLNYEAWTPADVDAFVDAWHPVVNGWMCAFSCSDLFPAWRAAFERVGRVSFAPVACVIRGMSVRLAGDGPSNWTIYLNVARPRSKAWSTWGTRNGAYVVGRGNEWGRIGGKPLALMQAIIRDYTRPGDLVVDPMAGYATTLIAADMLGRHAIGAEVDRDTYERAMQRIERPRQMDMFG